VYKAYLTKDQFDSLKKDVKLLNALRLSRIVNAIRASRSMVTKFINDNTSSGSRDKFEAILYYGAVLYESLKTFHEMKEQFNQLAEYKANSEDIKYLCSEFENKSSFTRTILAKIRDKLVFHFDKDVFMKTISEMDLPNDELIIVEGDSGTNIDTNYSATTMLYFHYLFSFINKDIPDKDKLIFVYENMDLISGKICKTAESIILGLLKEHVAIGLIYETSTRGQKGILPLG
jgi:hypothetical protein